MDKLILKIPKNIDQSFYEDSFIKIKNYVFKRMNFVTSIIRFGNIKHPGISDLDLILVIKDGTKNIDLNLLLFKRYLRKSHSEIICHFPLIIPEKIVPDLNHLFPIFNYQIIYRDGEKRSIELFSTIAQQKFHLLQVFLSKFPCSFENYKQINNLNFRDFLLEINSLKHTFKIFQGLHPGDLHSKISKFNNNIDRIRQDQIDGISQEKKELNSFLDDTEKLFFKMIKVLNSEKSDDFLLKNENVKSSWVLDQLILISLNKSSLSRLIKKEYLGNLDNGSSSNSYSKTLKIIDTYINETSKYSLLFGSTYITLGIETSLLKRILKSVIQFYRVFNFSS